MPDDLQQLGEFGVIELFRQAARPSGSRVVAGIGDDCAVMRVSEAEYLLVTTDMLVERVHFLREDISPRQLGRKSLMVNLSDIAAMGGRPTAAFLGMGLTADLRGEYLTEFRDGLLECASDYKVDLLGGDTVAAQADLVFCLTVLGVTKPDQLVTRAGARPGDRIMLAGIVGDSAAGLHLLLNKSGQQLEHDYEKLIQAHLEPQAQVGLGHLLASKKLVSAMIDVSDGVLQDLAHICRASAVGADILADKLPLSEQACRLAKSVGHDALEWGLSGGEDFILMFCCSEDKEDQIRNCCLTELGTQVFTIGTITKDKKIRVNSKGVWLDRSVMGYDHFRGA
jgi:thiamine-monophosphate kinase